MVTNVFVFARIMIAFAIVGIPSLEKWLILAISEPSSLKYRYSLSLELIERIYLSDNIALVKRTISEANKEYILRIFLCLVRFHLKIRICFVFSNTNKIYELIKGQSGFLVVNYTSCPFLLAGDIDKFASIIWRTRFDRF